MIDLTILKQKFPNLSQALLDEIAHEASLVEIPARKEILREGQYVKSIPLVLEGLVKVFANFEERELLLYYIRPQESCAMSFSAGLENLPSKVRAITEEPSQLLLLPADKLKQWIQSYSDFNQVFFQQYNLRYSELLDTIQSLLFGKMDQRLLAFLKERSKLSTGTSLRLSHREIANELGTAREVISRVIKKLENEGHLIQAKEGIILN